jgi:general stress protein 26
MSASLTEIAAYVGKQVLAVQSSVAANGTPQAAVVGVVANDALELFFDTLGDTRKAANLRRDARVAFVLGWNLAEACTVQLEGLADEPSGADLEAWKTRYFTRFPDGVARQEWPGIIYFRVRPTWIRHSDFRGASPAIAEFDAAALAAFRKGSHR